jgi:NADH-quinone oxidoreductase subunit E
MSTRAPVETFVLSSEGEARLQEILDRYPTRQSALMPALWVVQEERGHIPPAAVAWLAARLEVTEARVWELITFYAMFRSEPQAEHVLQVCRNISCHILGAPSIVAHLEKRLGIRLGQTTPDGKFALEGVECLGACGLGPALQVGKHFYERLTPAKVDAILEGLRRGDPPRPDTDRPLKEEA